jgi:hypothetical protein
VTVAHPLRILVVVAVVGELVAGVGIVAASGGRHDLAAGAAIAAPVPHSSA